MLSRGKTCGTQVGNLHATQGHEVDMGDCHMRRQSVVGSTGRDSKNTGIENVPGLVSCGDPDLEDSEGVRCEKRGVHDMMQPHAKVCCASTILFIE